MIGTTHDYITCKARAVAVAAIVTITIEAILYFMARRILLRS